MLNHFPHSVVMTFNSELCISLSQPSFNLGGLILRESEGGNVSLMI